MQNQISMKKMYIWIRICLGGAWYQNLNSYALSVLPSNLQVCMKMDLFSCLTDSIALKKILPEDPEMCELSGNVSLEPKLQDTGSLQ